MRYQTLPGVDREASVLAMGSTYFGSEMAEGLVFDVLDRFVEIGGNFLDTARVYGDFANDVQGLAEGTIGRWMRTRGNRQNLIVATKGGHPCLRTMNVGRLDRKNLTEDLSRSLDALETGWVDLYFLHRDDVNRPVGEIVETLNGFCEQKKIRAFGASNWSAERILEANEYAAAHGLRGFSANGPQWSLARQLTQEDKTLRQMDAPMYAMHQKTRLACVPYSSQAKGFFIKLFEGGEENLSPKAKRRYWGDENLAIYTRLLALQEKTRLSVGALSLAYLTSQSFPVFPIVGVSRIQQVDALSEAGDARLNAEDLSSLMALTQLSHV